MTPFDLGSPWQHRQASTPVSAKRLNDREQAIVDQINGQAASLLSVESKVATLSKSLGVPALDRLSMQSAADAAEAAGGGLVRAFPGDDFDLDSAGQKTFASSGATLYDYCVEWGTGVIFDTNGATIGLAAGEDAVLFSAKAGATKWGLVGYGTVHGRSRVLTGKPLVWVDGVDGVTLDLKLKDTYHQGIYLPDCTHVEAPRIHSDGCQGNPIGLGLSTHPVTHSRFGSIVSNNTSPDPSNTTNFPGNPIAGVVKWCSFAQVDCNDNTAGVKVDEASEGSIFALVNIKGNAGGTGNSGFKLQGTATNPVKRITVAVLNVEDQQGTGLYMDLTEDCAVAVYNGRNNGQLATFPDVWINGLRDVIGTLNSTNAGVDAIAIRFGARDFNIGEAVVRNPNQTNTASRAALSMVGGTGEIGRLLAVDELDPPRTPAVAAVVGGGTFAAATYFWRVTAINAQGETTASSQVSAAIALNGSATLTWAAVTGATGYNIYRTTNSDGQQTSPAFIAAVGAVTTYTDTGTAASAGSIPAVNTASTQKMKVGISNTHAATQVRVRSFKIAGAVTPVSLGSAPMRTEGLVSGNPTSGRVVLTTEPPTMSPDVQVFTGSGTWTKPAAATTVSVVAISGGGGGGGGRRSASGTVANGGGGGGGGGFVMQQLRASDLGATEAVTVGAGGTAGASAGADSTDGGAGGGGGVSSFGSTRVRAQGGGGGSGGTTTTGVAGGGAFAMSSGAAGGTASTTGGVGGNGSNGAAGAPGGGAGGGVTGAPAANAGGNGGGSLPLGFGTAGVGGSGANGGAGSGSPIQQAIAGYGGGGGGGNAAGAGFTGGAGGVYGAGGGGGGGCLNGAASGAGGAGAAGIVVVTSW